MPFLISFIRGFNTCRFSATLLASGLLISKQRIDAKVIKKYDKAKTPYRRLMESSDISEAVKAELHRRKNSLDLQQLLEATHALQSKLISMA